MKKIPLRGKNGTGKFAMVDDEDFELVNQWKWSVGGAGYPTGSVYVESRGRKWPVLMHRYLLSTPKGMEADHINGDKLDNRRRNIRNCTPLQNMVNRGLTKLNTSGYKGVSWDESRKKWAVRIKIEGKTTHIGRYTNIETAARAYDIKAKEIYGEFAKINFPLNTNPYQPVIEFENMLADWCGSKYCVTTDSCTSAMFLSLQYRKKQLGEIGIVEIPSRTYPSAPCNIIHCGGKVKFHFNEWQGEYELYPLNVWDSALRFTKGMFKGGSALQCLSFHIKKRLGIGRGGAILTDDIEAVEWLKKARFDGRAAVPLIEDNFDMLGWNCYMTPEQGARGIQMFSLLYNKDYLDDLPISEQNYPDLSLYPVYQQ